MRDGAGSRDKTGKNGATSMGAAGQGGAQCSKDERRTCNRDGAGRALVMRPDIRQRWDEVWRSDGASAACNWDGEGWRAAWDRAEWSITS